MKYLFLNFFILYALTFLNAQSENTLSMQDWQYPYELHKISISDSTDIAYVDEGTGKETLLFIHGLGSNLKAWQKNIDVLQKNYRCIAIDLPGYGKSSKGSYSFSMSFFSSAIANLIDKLAIEKPVIIGHSMGGQIAMHLALDYPEVVDKLILVAPAGLETFTQQEGAIIQSVVTPAIMKATTEDQIISNFHLNFYSFPDDAQFMIEDRMLMRKTVEYDHFCSMIPKCVEGMLKEPVLDQLSSIEAPTLIIYGENDALIPNKYLHPSSSTLKIGQTGSQAIPDGKLEVVAEAGHFVQWEQAEIVSGLIVAFLNQ